MLQTARYDEDLLRLAADAYEVSGRLCGSCRDMPTLWPYIRLARASFGEPGEVEALLKAAGFGRRVPCVGRSPRGYAVAAPTG